MQVTIKEYLYEIGLLLFFFSSICFELVSKIVVVYVLFMQNILMKFSKLYEIIKNVFTIKTIIISIVEIVRLRKNLLGKNSIYIIKERNSIIKGKNKKIK